MSTTAAEFSPGTDSDSNPDESDLEHVESDIIVKLRAEVDALKLQLTAVLAERDNLLAKVTELERKTTFHLRSKESLLETLRTESAVIGRHCEQLVADTNRRSVEELVGLRERSVSVQERNGLLKDVVHAFAGCENVQCSEPSATKKRFHCSMAIEHIYAAKNLKFVSEFNILAMFVAYAVSGSRMVVDMLGRIGPGGSYSLLKQWLATMSSKPAYAPPGFIRVAFDNEQKIRKNYLT